MAEQDDLKKLPSVNDLEEETRKEVMDLMDALAEVVERRVAIHIQEDELKDKLEELQKATGRPGFKYGTLTFRVDQVAGRKSLDPALLLENGVSIAVLQASYKEGKPYAKTTFRDLGEA